MAEEEEEVRTGREERFRKEDGRNGRLGVQ